MAEEVLRTLGEQIKPEDTALIIIDPQFVVRPHSGMPPLRATMLSEFLIALILSRSRSMKPLYVMSGITLA